MENLFRFIAAVLIIIVRILVIPVTILIIAGGIAFNNIDDFYEWLSNYKK